MPTMALNGIRLIELPAWEKIGRDGSAGVPATTLSSEGRRGRDTVPADKGRKTGLLRSDLTSVHFSDTVKGWQVGRRTIVAKLDTAPVGAATQLATRTGTFKVAIEHHTDAEFATTIRATAAGLRGNVTTGGKQATRANLLPA